MGKMSFSGIDTSAKPYLLFYDVRELKDSLKVCVKDCPKKTINSTQGIYDYYKEGVGLCRYDFDYNELKSPNPALLSGSFGPCPVLPIYER